MARPIGAWSKQYAKESAEIHMDSVVSIVKPSEVFAPDLTDGYATVQEPIVYIYEGPARIWGASQSGNFSIGENADFATKSINISIPWDTELIPNVDNVCEILSCPEDQDLVNRAFRITGVTAGGSIMATRRLTGVMLDENRSWE
jgi:hypothetical protein